MHEGAEHGVAAHWHYAEQKSEKSYRKGVASLADAKETAWVSELKDWQQDIADADEFMNSLKIDFFRHRIFCLTPKGDVVDLPEGATALDFAYRVHTKIGDAATGARVNGKMVPLNHELSNAEVIEIITQKNKKPNPDWLAFVKTSMAKKHIQAFVRRDSQEKVFAARHGKLLVEVRVIAKDRLGLLNELTAVVTSFKIVMKGVRTEREQRSHPLIIMNCPVKSNDELRKLMMKLKSVKGVLEVENKILA